MTNAASPPLSGRHTLIGWGSLCLGAVSLGIPVATVWNGPFLLLSIPPQTAVTASVTGRQAGLLVLSGLVQLWLAARVLCRRSWTPAEAIGICIVHAVPLIVMAIAVRYPRVFEDALPEFIRGPLAVQLMLATIGAFYVVAASGLRQPPGPQGEPEQAVRTGLGPDGRP